ncbi:DUF222 domain-containing protein [Mycobacterium pseudokansasii]
MFEHGALGSADLDQLTPEQLVTAIEGTYRQESALTARRLACVAALLRHRSAAERRDPDLAYATIDGAERTCAEVAAALNVSSAAAAYQVHCAEMLDTRLRRIGALLAEGRIDWRTAQLTISRTDLVNDDKLIARLDESLAARMSRWQGWSRQRVINAIDRQVLAIDPDAARERRRRADDEREIGITPHPDGMAELWGIVTGADATAFDRKLSHLATAVCRDDPRTLAQRRADALGALTAGGPLACRCGSSDCPARRGGAQAPTGAQVLLNVVATADTLSGKSQQPGYVEGYGVIDADLVRELATSATRRLIADLPSDADALTYHPSTALDRAVRCRDLTCRFPGCSRPARICDIDHTIPFNHTDPGAGGLTVLANLKCLCRKHHRLKTFHGGVTGMARQTTARRHGNWSKISLMHTPQTAIYLRQSLDRDQNQLAIDRQRDDLLKLCKRLGWANPVQYADNNVSATKGRRQRYEELCRDIADGVIGRVAVWDMDRLHRQPRELEGFIDLVERHHVELANVGGSVDLSTPAGRYFARTRGAAARFEVEHKAERQKSANRQRAKAGKAWNVRSFGWKGDKLVAREANAIRKASRDLLNGASLWSIAAQWNSQGLKTVKGCGWTGGTVRQVLTRASNAGLVTYDVRAAQAEARIKGKPVHLAGIVEGAEPSRPAIVDRDVWEGVCTLLADPKRHTGKSPGRKHLLSGIAICDACRKPIGTGVRGTKTGGKRAVYSCKRIGCMKIVRGVELTDKRVVDAITKRLAEPDAAVTLARPTVDAKALRDQIELLRGQIREAEADYDDGQITAARMNARIERVEAKLKPLQDTLLGSHMSADVKALAGRPDAAKRFAALPLDRQRGVIDTLATVTIHALNRPGGRFDPKAITVDFERK